MTTDFKQITDITDKPAFLLGSNYWPAHAGLNMWSDWQPGKIKTELLRMVDLGFNVHRSFLFMPDFIPTPDRVEPEMLDRLVEYLDICDYCGLGTILSFFVGHMSGEDWDVPWRQGRNFYSDPTLLKIQQMYVETIVQTCTEANSLIGWILSNEIPNYEPEGSPADVTSWARTINKSIRKFDQKHPISIGDGCWSPEISRRLTNFRLRDLAQHQDFLGIHFYPRSGNPWHQSFTAAFRTRLAQQWGRPVVVEEFGHSAAMGSEINQAHYYRSILYSALINDARGTLNWCFADFELPDVRPYSHHPHELQFGLMKPDGSYRKAASEMQKFGGVTKSLDTGNWQKIEQSKVGLIIPSCYYNNYPYDWDNEFTEWYSLYLNNFSLMKRAGLNPSIIYEPAIDLENDGIKTHEIKLDPDEYPVIFCPRLKRLNARFWLQIQGYVKAGGILYTSFAHDSWLPDQEELFKIETDLKFGLPYYHDSESIRVSTCTQSGEQQSSFILNLIRNEIEFANCPILNYSGEKIMEDTAGNPVVLTVQHGSGKIFYSPYPLEMLALNDNSLQNDALLKKIYQIAAGEIQNQSAVRIDGEDIESGIWLDQNAGILKIIILNHSWDSRDCSIIINPHHSTRDYQIKKNYNLSAMSVEVDDIQLDSTAVKEMLSR